MTRPDWLNLNGEWQLRQSSTNDAPQFNTNLPERINVPFPVESALSGVMRPASDNRHYLFYRRTFAVPAGWSGRRVQLNFGAVDWQTTVWVNGVQVGTHTGGYDAFSFDVTPQLNGGTNELVLRVWDPTDSRQNGSLPAIGKQTKTDIHPDHRRGRRSQRLPDLRPADRQDGPDSGARRQPGGDQRLQGTASAAPVSLPLNTRRSLQVTTPGFTDRYLRHMDSRLANATCYSFESVNFPGQFLRHANFRVRISVNDASALMRADATWCARSGLTGSSVSLESFNFRGSFLRHANAEVWLSNGSGNGPDNPTNVWAPDSTWNIVAPWAP